MARIFLCHASEDKSEVRDVCQRLKALGFEPWLDEEVLLPGQEWAYEIPLALKASDFILIFFSSTMVSRRGYVHREMKLALDALQEIPAGEIFVIPIRLDECEVPEQFRRYHYANLFDPRGFDLLVRALHHGLEQRGKQSRESLETPPVHSESTDTASAIETEKQTTIPDQHIRASPEPAERVASLESTSEEAQPSQSRSDASVAKVHAGISMTPHASPQTSDTNKTTTAESAISRPDTFFLLNDDIELNWYREPFIQKVFKKSKS